MHTMRFCPVFGWLFVFLVTHIKSQQSCVFIPFLMTALPALWIRMERGALPHGAEGQCCQGVEGPPALVQGVPLGDGCQALDVGLEAGRPGAGCFFWVTRGGGEVALKVEQKTG